MVFLMEEMEQMRNTDDLPTGCATRLLLGVNRLLNHCRSPHAKKRWWIVAFLLNVGTRCVMRFRDQDGPN